MINAAEKERLLQKIEERLQMAGQQKVPFSVFLEQQMDRFDYSNTSLAKKVVHRVERKGEVQYLPVTRQTIGAWLKGCMPSSREIYISLGMAFSMKLEEINYILLENYMGYGLYCKNIEDALWIAVINGLFPMEEMEQKRAEVERMLAEDEEEETHRSIHTIGLFEVLANVRTMQGFFETMKMYKKEFREGARQFGQCLEEVIQEEYGYYDKAAWFLRDIGCLHCEAQFSKIRAGKAVVTREWLLRFCIALQPSYESIEKLLAKAQMAPLGVTPVEIIIEMIAKYKADALANSQEVWLLIEAAAQALGDRGYEMEEDLCRKYNGVYELPVAQKWWISICIGKQLLLLESMKDYGYEKTGYARYSSVDRVLFDDLNRLRKNPTFKTMANAAWNREEGWREYGILECHNLRMEANNPSDPMEMEKFEEYCYLRKPNKFSKDFQKNDVYFYGALLYSIWTGKCYQKDFDAVMAEQMREQMKAHALQGDALLGLLEKILGEHAAQQPYLPLEQLLDAVDGLKPLRKNE